MLQRPVDSHWQPCSGQSCQRLYAAHQTRSWKPYVELLDGSRRVSLLVGGLCNVYCWSDCALAVSAPVCAMLSAGSRQQAHGKTFRSPQEELLEIAKGCRQLLVSRETHACKSLTASSVLSLGLPLRSLSPQWVSTRYEPVPIAVHSRMSWHLAYT